jgi:hypothetical protein
LREAFFELSFDLQKELSILSSVLDIGDYSGCLLRRLHQTPLKTVP